MTTTPDDATLASLTICEECAAPPPPFDRDGANSGDPATLLIVSAVVQALATFDQ